MQTSDELSCIVYYADPAARLALAQMCVRLNRTVDSLWHEVVPDDGSMRTLYNVLQPSNVKDFVLTHLGFEHLKYCPTPSVPFHEWLFMLRRKDTGWCKLCRLVDDNGSLIDNDDDDDLNNALLGYELFPEFGNDETVLTRWGAGPHPLAPVADTSVPIEVYLTRKGESRSLKVIDDNLGINGTAKGRIRIRSELGGMEMRDAPLPTFFLYIDSHEASESENVLLEHLWFEGIGIKEMCRALFQC